MTHSSKLMLATVALVAGMHSNASSADLEFLSQRTFAARDSLNVGREDNADARDCLDGLIWKPAEFTVRCQPPRKNRGDALVRFPSPIVSGDKQNDSVSMEWFLARGEDQRPIDARAVVVVHESGRNMIVGRLVANGFRLRGFHAFLIHLPFYGERRTGEQRPKVANLFKAVRQAVADVRRARDAVAVLPFVDSKHIALQGTSLGGFVAATTAGLDSGFDSVFVTLAGGDLYDMIQNGKRDTARARELLAKAGVTDDEIRRATRIVEPIRLAHRMRSDRTWLYSARFDTVVPMKNADALAKAAGLSGKHHLKLFADHYTGLLYVTLMLDHMVERAKR